MSDPAELDELCSIVRPDLSVEGTIRNLTRLFAKEGVPDHARDARILVLSSLGLDPVDFIRDPGRTIGAGHELIREWAIRRLAREPVSRILGRREFWSLDLTITPAVLDPRPDSETLVAAATEAFQSRQTDRLRILDLGTGSGALLCALLSEFPSATGLGVDLSAEACAVARTNLERLGLADRGAIECGGWTQSDGAFDIVVSNPPYVRSGQLRSLEPEVRLYDPCLALDGGKDGLCAYKQLASEIVRRTHHLGSAFVELGIDQGDEALCIFQKAGFGGLSFRCDLAGIRRVLCCSHSRETEAKKDHS